MGRIQYGEHFDGLQGYRIIEGNDAYKHKFGGQDCDLPDCKLCGNTMHQIFCFDLKDEKLSELRDAELTILPLVSCLNCAMVWEPQYFKLSNEGKKIEIISQENTENWLQEAEDMLPVPLPSTNVMIIHMKDQDIPTNEESYWTAFHLFGTEYLCRLLGAPLYDDVPDNLECPTCSKEMIYIAAITQDLGERKLISVVDFQLGEMNIYYHLCKECLVIKTQIQGT